MTNHENREECAKYFGKHFFDEMTEIIRKKQTELHKHSVLTVPSNYYAIKYSNEMSVSVKGASLGVCLENFPVPKARRRGQVRRHESDPIRILLPSRLKFYQKGHDIALDACSELKKVGVSLTLTISGINESYREDLDELFRMAEIREIRENLTAKRYANIQSAYDETDVVISPERFCSYGLAISEALAGGIPTVLSDIPTYKEIAQDFSHALFMRSGNPSDLAHQICASQKLDAELLANEAVRFREIYDLRHCARTFSRLYRMTQSNND